MDRSVLLSSLISGLLWLLVPVALGSWPLALLGAAYVAVASLLLAAFYARPAISPRSEVMVWVAPWLAAVALWTTVVAGVEGGTSGWLVSVWGGSVLGTACFVAWQVPAFLARQVMARDD